MAKGLAQRLSGFGNTIGEKLFGTQQMTVQPGAQYPQELQSYLDDFENQQYVKDLLNKPAHERMTLEQLKDGFTQGLNFGSKDMADAQKKLNINIPKTGEDINLAQVGEFNSYPLQSTITAGERQGGFFNDLAKGYNENYSQKFDFDNLKPQNKNFATKTGEFLGSVGRFVDSPLGRGLLAAGLNKALGYDDSIQEGLTAYVGRQNAQTQDNLFRKSLVDDYGFSPEEIGGIKGNITKDLYNTIAANRYKQQSMQLKRELSEAKDNVSRARMISTMLNNGSITPREAQLRMAEYGITVDDVQKSNQTRNTDMNEQLLPYKQQAYIFGPQMAMANYGLARDRFNYQQMKDAYDREHPRGASFNEVASLRKEFTSLPPVKNATEITRQYNNVNSLYTQYKQGKIGKNAFDQALITTLNKVLDPTSVVRESEFDRTSAGQAMWDKLAGYSQKLSKGGSGLTDANRADLVNALTTMKKANDAEVQQISMDYTDLAQRYGINPADIMPRHYRATNTSNSGNKKDNSQIISKLKANGYSDEKIQQYLQAKGLI